VLANYRVPPSLLSLHVPPGSELDTPDGQPDLHLVSLVAFNFSRTHVHGIPLPTAQEFAEVNVRFYVRRGSMRAVVFLREFVPPWLVVVGARLLYHQPYARAAITHRVHREGDQLIARTTLASRAVRGELVVRAHAAPTTPPPDSIEHFLKEHYWGFDRDRRGRSFKYRVDHPVWRIFPVVAATISLTPGRLLGGGWADVDWDSSFHSVVFAEGSPAIVYHPRPLIEAPSISG
jgi:uncharacterized protein YqjF (DUF2071 family)